MWRNESPEVRSLYEKLSSERKIQHQLDYPDYRFRPSKKPKEKVVKEVGVSTKSRNHTVQPSSEDPQAASNQLKSTHAGEEVAAKREGTPENDLHINQHLSTPDQYLGGNISLGSSSK